jgi:ribosomal protein S18 acetylase RimI-like enzyme
LEIIRADLSKRAHGQAFLELTARYMGDAMGGGAAWTADQSQKVLREMQKHPSAMVLLAKSGEQYMGVCTCFYGYSTFLASGLYNIHDIYVLPGYRGRGIGRAMLRRVESMARAQDVARITLEVREDNLIAQRLYRQEGYGYTTPPMLFLAKNL